VKVGRQFKKASVFDLDGTLADVKDLEGHHKHRHEGFAQIAKDAPEIKKNVKKLHKEEKKGRKVVILTARSDSYRPETEDWLKEHDIKPDELVMRPTHDTAQKDKVVKQNLLNSKVLPKYKVKDAFDDKQKNVKMLKKFGIKAKKV